MHVPRAIPDIAALPRPVFARNESLTAGSQTHAHSHHWAQFTYAVHGVLEVRTRQGNHMTPPQRAIWIPVGLPHAVITSGPVELRSLYIDPAALAALWNASPVHCRVVEVTPLARELEVAFSRLPREYDEHGTQGRLVGVLLDELVACPRPACLCRCPPTRGWPPCASPCPRPRRGSFPAAPVRAGGHERPYPDPAVSGRNRACAAPMATAGAHPGRPARIGTRTRGRRRGPGNGL